jgi:hypothetical protein
MTLNTEAVNSFEISVNLYRTSRLNSPEDVALKLILIIRCLLYLTYACCPSVQNLLSSRLLYKNVKIRIQKIIILPVVLYGCETCSLTLMEEHRLRISENRVLRRIFRPKRNEVTGGWRKLHIEEINKLYSSTSTVRTMKPRRMKWAGHVAQMGESGMHIGYWWES